MRAGMRSRYVDRRRLRSGFEISIAIHAALLLGFHFEIPDEHGPNGRRNPARAGHAIQLMPVTTSTPAVAEIVAPGRAMPERTSAFVTFSPPLSKPAPAVGERLPLLSAPEREKMKTIVDPLSLPRERIDRRIGSYHDSLAAARSAENEITEIAHVTPDGDRWGASNGKLHLGSLALPYCGGAHSVLDCGFGAAPGRIDEFQARIRTFSEIAVQRDRLAAEKIFTDRIRAMRERVRLARDAVRSGTR